MNILRRLLLGLVGSLFIILLFTTAFDIGFTRIATRPESIKKLISGSGIYNSAVPSILQQTKKIDILGGTFSSKNPILINAANQAIPPEYIQQNTELVIDSVYRWLDGKTTAPDFEVKLTDIKARFADNLAAEVEKHSAGLPACKTPQEVSENNDPLTALCLPPELTPEYIAATVKEGILSNQDFIKQPDFTAYDINSGSKNIPIFQRKGIKDAPMYYHRAKMSPVVLSVLTILAALCIVFLSSSRPIGLRRAGVSLLIVGVIMMVSAFALNHESTTQIVPKIKVDNVGLQASVRNLATDIIQQIDRNYWFFGGLYTALGAGMIVGGETFRRRAQPKHALSATEPEPDAPKEAPVPAEEPKKSKPKKVKIQ